MAADTKRGADWWFCPICGPQAESDEDGLCVTCGATVCAFSTLCSTLAAQGLHVVTAAEKAVLDAMCGPTESEYLGEDLIGHYRAELLNEAIVARREAAK